jgi:hypothetical protein
MLTRFPRPSQQWLIRPLAKGPAYGPLRDKLLALLTLSKQANPECVRTYDQNSSQA